MRIYYPVEITTVNLLDNGLRQCHGQCGDYGLTLYMTEQELENCKRTNEPCPFCGFPLYYQGKDKFTCKKSRCKADVTLRGYEAAT